MARENEELLISAAAAEHAGDETPPEGLTEEERARWLTYYQQSPEIRSRGLKVDVPGDWV